MEKTSSIVIRVSSQEKSELQSIATKAGMSLSAFLLSRARTNPPTIQPPPIDSSVHTKSPPPSDVHTPLKINLTTTPLHKPDQRQNDPFSAYTSRPKTPDDHKQIPIDPTIYT